MGTDLVLNMRLRLVVAIMAMPFIVLSAITLSDGTSYIVSPSCESPSTDKPTAADRYYYELEVIAMSEPEQHLEIVLDGNPLTQFHVTQEDLPYKRFVGPFTHSGVGGSFHEYILRSLDTAIADTLYVGEVVCGYSTSNGLNNAGYYCSRTAYGVIAQTQPASYKGPQLPEKTYVYALVHKESQKVAAKNFSGHFGAAADLEEYEIHAYATTFETSSDFINNIIIGQGLDQSSLALCFSLCGVYDVLVDCSSFDLRLEKNVRGGIVYSLGDTVTYDITVFNEGRVTAYDIQVRDYKPDALRFLPAMNPGWNLDLESLKIDSILSGESALIPIYMIVDNVSDVIEVRNVAEIIRAGDRPDIGIIAFDIDSTPDNDEMDEDDIDDDVIIIIENLCEATFLIELMPEPVCINEPMKLSAMVHRSNGGLRYFWRHNGMEISRDSILIIPNHGTADYGRYELTVLDTMGCTGTEFIEISPINDEDRFSCFSDIYIGINERCEMFLRPDMFTNRNVSAINDYIIEIRDQEGALVDQQDLWTYGSNTVLEGRVVNPCTRDVICWSNLHIEHKGRPEGHLIDNTYHIPCALVTSEDPSAIIQIYNQRYLNDISDGAQYTSLLNQQTCLQEWEVQVQDIFVPSEDMCSHQEVWRIYSIYDQEVRITLDTAILQIEKLDPSFIQIPVDNDNVSCNSGYDPEAINSFPIYISGTDTIQLWDTGTSSSLVCNLGITYSDHKIGDNCTFAINKIRRTWSISNWCSDQVVSGDQFVYIVDSEAPQWENQDTITIEVAPYACYARIDIAQYVQVVDQCDPAPRIFLQSNASEDLIVDLGLGMHALNLSAEDQCGNLSQSTVRFRIIEYTPPAAILNKSMVIGLSEDISTTTNYITATQIDAGSHDHDCGPVVVSIARLDEVSILNSNGGQVGLDRDLYNCEPIHATWDSNNDLLISNSEIYRDKVIFCCRDIDKIVMLSVRVVDESGNTTYVEVGIEVQAKREYSNCDDGDPCTIDDRAYGDCPCQGSLVTRDEDHDAILDCQDDFIQMCLNNKSITVEFPQIDSFLLLGAIGGTCTGNEEVAMIAGVTRTKNGAEIENVEITLNDFQNNITDAQGAYAFDNNAMYTRYELRSSKNDDPLNGVSAKDLLILQEYLIGLRTLDDPYLKIAADVNDDGMITALDLVDLRKVLLGQELDFPSNDSWRFIIENFKWEDIRDPFNYEEVNIIGALQKDMMHENWIGVKIGDLSGDVITNYNTAVIRSNKSLALQIEDRKVVSGDRIIATFFSKRNVDIKALQLSLSLEGLEFSGIRSQSLGIEPQDLYIPDVSLHSLSLLWYDVRGRSTKDALWDMEFEVKKDGQLSDMISLNTNMSLPRVYYDDLGEGPLQLEFIKGKEISVAEKRSVMYQNQPNPFNGQTLIQFELPEAGDVNFVFYSLNGMKLHEVTGDFGVGTNAISLSDDIFEGYSGIIYYQMIFGDEHHTRAMVRDR